MAPIFLTTVLTCKQLFAITNNIFQNLMLTESQKSELISELRIYIPSCPVYIKPNGKTK